MEGRLEQKWKTLRNVSSSEQESDRESHVVEKVVGSESKMIESSAEISQSLPDEGPVRILVAHPVGSTTRLVRETLENFTEAEVETTSNALRAFELALQKSYQLFFFGMQNGELSGPLLYELISKAYSCGRGVRQMAPGVVFLREMGDPKLPEELERDVRVKDVISKPVRIERILKSVEHVAEVKDPTAR